MEDKVQELRTALRNLLKVPHDEDCEYHLGGFYVCSKGCFRRARLVAEALVAEEVS